jgi:hypothetical protein
MIIREFDWELPLPLTQKARWAFQSVSRRVGLEAANVIMVELLEKYHDEHLSPKPLQKTKKPGKKTKKKARSRPR